ncbi:ABC protein [Mycena sanguinolenta]|uniref:ABC protein n=1 Tax=Mycena sanguinolenta TaxID=230812 RepID=A0A8H6XHP6_9AGAR|nr:ABC protein [Mycena sanguinolenta]
MALQCSNCGNFYSGPPGPIIVSVSPGTRHHTLLNTNEPPEDSELTFIHSVVSETTTRLTHLDDEISTLRERLKQLRDERTALSSYHTRNKAILSPLRRMPPEVLAEIFSWTLPAVQNARRSSFNMLQSPWLLTRISSRWRAVSVSTPILWSRLVMDYTGNSTVAPPLTLVETQIHRAQKLHIHFYGNPSLYADSEHQIRVFELLSKQSSRWEELSIGITLQMLPLLTAVRGRMPSLKRLWIDIQWYDSPPVQSLDCFQTAPSLIDFGVNHLYRCGPIGVPAQQLTRYYLDAPWQRHSAILKLARNLVEAHIILPVDERWTNATEIITLPHLRRLFLSCLAALDYLKAPALEGFAMWASDTVRPVESFLGRSDCALRTLCLRGPDAYAITHILPKFPSIAELALTVDNGDQAEMDSLMSALSSPKVAPRLRSLIFGFESYGVDNYTTFLQMLRARWEIDGSALTDSALLLAEGWKPDPGTLDLLHALRLDGLDLRILAGREALEEIYSWFYASNWVLWSS